MLIINVMNLAEHFPVHFFLLVRVILDSLKSLTVYCYCWTFLVYLFEYHNFFFYTWIIRLKFLNDQQIFQCEVEILFSILCLTSPISGLRDPLWGIVQLLLDSKSNWDFISHRCGQYCGKYDPRLFCSLTSSRLKFLSPYARQMK